MLYAFAIILLPSHSGSYDRSPADFLLLKNISDKEEFSTKIEKIGQSHPQFKESKVSLLSLNDIYFNNKGQNNAYNVMFSRFGDKKNVNVLIVIMIVVFAITALNFSGFQVILINGGMRNAGLSRVMGISASELLMQKLAHFTSWFGSILLPDLAAFYFPLWKNLHVTK